MKDLWKRKIKATVLLSWCHKSQFDSDKYWNTERAWYERCEERIMFHPCFHHKRYFNDSVNISTIKIGDGAACLHRLESLLGETLTLTSQASKRARARPFPSLSRLENPASERVGDVSGVESVSQAHSGRQDRCYQEEVRMFVAV